MTSVAEFDAGRLVEVQLSRADISEIFALYLSALRAVPNPAAVRPDEPSFFDEIFDAGGEIIGFRDDGRLVAYGVIRPELDSEHDRHGLAPRVAPSAKLYVLDGSAVWPALWRHGLQRMIIETRIRRVAALGAVDVIAKASPGNFPSMRNLLNSRFAIITKVMKPYGWRYVHHRRVAFPAPDAGTGTWIEAGNVEEAERRFSAGEAAFACRAGPDGMPILRFADYPL